ncbi:uncharacterized protein N7458_009318 [Penicillium daleae]|uniref:Phytanoyl-CoA dioxygenase n=1 Tax=Penicillium daleae TaxID=63821 RepID=A0AAD6BXA2_9EURO|nr:uncharacterized protein N7458_009318 [Penicillium daleae]KAJ5438320.1 hypothetical protein N7458_009318 [Penicillium daleae]
MTTAAAHPQISCSLDKNELQNFGMKAGNGDPLPDIGLLKPSTMDLPMGELRKRYNEDGYLWMKGILDEEKVLDVREQYFRFMTENGDTGILAKGTDPRDGIFSGEDWRNFLLPGALRVFNGLSDEGAFVDKAFKAHVADFYQQFKVNVEKPLREFVGELRQFRDPMLLKRTLLRCNVPGGETTPVHYDQIFLRDGPPTSITAWIPLGDCPLAGGGLMYLDNSVPIGEKFEADFSEKSKSLTDEERVSAFNKNMMAGGFIDRNAAKFGKYWGRRWLVAHYEAGDVVFHNPFKIHASCRNESPEGIIRLSTDLRFVDQAEPFDERWLYEAYQDSDPNVASRQSQVSGGNGRR